MCNYDEITEANKLVKWLIAITIIIILLNIINFSFNKPSWLLDTLMNVDYESSFPTWFASSLWLIAAYLAYGSYKIAKKNKLAHNALLFFSLIMVSFSIDEVACLHENAGIVITKRFHFGKGWVTALAPFILLVTISLIISLYKALKKCKKATLFIFIGLGMVIFGAVLLEYTITMPPLKYFTLYRNIEFILEEGLELFGTVTIIKGLIEYQKEKPAPIT
jgi:hypothetical protein